MRDAGQGPGAGDPGGADGPPASGARPLTASTLYVVSTPIGNLGDVTARAADVLRAADLVLCEDTRHSRRLLDHVGSRAPTTSVHEHNEARRAAELVERLTAGAAMALVSDAGTPLLSDPGARLVAAAIEAGVRVEPVPGASALLAALVASGVDATRFTFFGFLARKGRERRDALAEVAALRHTSVLYEAPGRAADTLADLAAACGPDRPAALARELTKQHEEVRRGTLAARWCWWWRARRCRRRRTRAPRACTKPRACCARVGRGRARRRAPSPSGSVCRGTTPTAPRRTPPRPTPPRTPSPPPRTHAETSRCPTERPGAARPRGAAPACR